MKLLPSVGKVKKIVASRRRVSENGTKKIIILRGNYIINLVV